jgi:hypothetical protein
MRGGGEHRDVMATTLERRGVAVCEMERENQ